MVATRDIPTKRWTSFGALLILLAALLVGFALYLAVSQAKALAVYRIADARNEAVRLRETAMQHIRGNIYDTLMYALQAYRTGPSAAIPTHRDRPDWIQRAFIWDGRRLLGDGQPHAQPNRIGDTQQLELLIRAQLESRRNRPAARDAGEIQFVVDTFQDNDVVLAYLIARPAPDHPIAAAAQISLSRLRDDFLDAHFAAGGKIQVVALRQSPSHSAYWSEPLSQSLQNIIIEPSSDFIESQTARVLWQIVLFVGVALVFLTVLAVTMWKFVTVVQREVALSRLKTDFAADVSHELKTPLALIRMFTETLSDGRVPTEQKRREYYDIITRESTRLTHLIDNILDFSRIEAGKKQYSFETVDIADVVRSTYETYRYDFDHQGFEHHLYTQDNLPLIQADSNAVAQAVVNLISNAMKYSDDEKRVDIDVVRETRRDKHGVLISVKDRGIGINPEDRVSLFDGFYRSRDERARKVRGTGLGLNLVKHIVDAHGGAIDVETRLVKGSVFRVFLPERPPAAEPASPP